MAYTASHLAKHALKQDSTKDLEATDVLIAFKLIATAAKYIEGTLEQTVLQPARCQDPFSSRFEEYKRLAI